MNKFVTEVTIKEVKRVVDGSGPESIYMSVVPDEDGIQLVIGAPHRESMASNLSPEGLTKLIAILTEVRGAM